LITIVWTDYLNNKANLRNFDLSKIESLVKYSTERYVDVTTGRYIVVGKHNNTLVMIPYEIMENTVTPITIHATTRQQINFRIKTGRLIYE
jgi:hypothetical protein